MKEVAMDRIPDCNFCGKEAVYDAPTSSGPWGYMCLGCYANNGTGSDVGSKLVKRRKVVLRDEQKTKKVKIVMPSESDMESACFDGLWYPECPYCGFSNACEPDGGSVWCGECEKKYEVGMCC